MRPGGIRDLPAGQLDALIHDGAEDVLLAVLGHRDISESHIAAILERLDLPAKVISAIAAEGSWLASEAVRVRLASHPRTPKRIATAVLRQLFLFDIVRVSLAPSAPADVRRLAEELIVARVPHLPIGEKLTLARRGPARVAGALLGEGHAQATKLALANPRLTEAQILRVVNKPGVPERAIAAIAEDARWSCRYNIRVALARNPHTPVAAVMRFLPQLTLADLRDLAALSELSFAARKQIQRELSRRAGKPSRTSREGKRCRNA